jgi:chromatin structure-remodeling complex subunit RSC1/2
MPPPRSENASEVRESIEAKGDDEDIEMEDAPAAPTDADAKDDEDDADVDADGDADDDGSPNTDRESQDMASLIESTSQYLCSYEEEYEFLGYTERAVPSG